MVRLEERINLIEFENLKKEAFLCPIFFENIYSEIQRITNDLLAKNPNGVLDQVRAMVKMTEASI